MDISKVVTVLFQGNLVKRISIGLVLGIILGLLSPLIESSFGLNLAIQAGFLGEFFIKALRAVAPVLVFILVISAIANRKQTSDSTTKMRSILILYIIGMLFSALVAVSVSFLFPTEIVLSYVKDSLNPPQSVVEVLSTLILNIVDNPINALITANYIGILAWALAIGIALNRASPTTKEMVQDLSDSVSKIVYLVINFTPIGVFGIVSATLADKGLVALAAYVHLLAVLVGSMLIVAFIVNPVIVYWKIRRNPYPLVWYCLRVSGLTAFFTRSSAANIPINMELAKNLKLDKETSGISIPLGATINMEGAAITISVLTLAATHSLGIEVSLFNALLLSVVAILCACGAAGIAGGSLLLIPLACSLFGIPNEIAVQVIGVGFIIGVLQDSAETALNSSTDIIFTAAVCMAEDNQQMEVVNSKLSS